LIQSAKHLLNNQVCSSCKFVYKNKGSFTITIDGKSIPCKTTFTVCNWDNIVLYKPRGMVMPMTKIVSDNDFCKRWEGI